MQAKKHTALTSLVASFLAFTFLLPEAKAWKPRTHALTANAALVDAADAHICLPGLSSNQIPIGETPLVGTFTQDGEQIKFNDLAHLGPYVRAGALGPDAWPDAVFGQLAIHADHSRFAPGDVFFGGQGQCPDPDGTGPQEAPEVCWQSVARTALGDDLYRRLVAPLVNWNPKWRSIDYGHEVMKAALSMNQFALAGKTRAEIESDPFLRGFLAERQAAIAFAHGYLMHFAGDSQAHTWINEIVGEPFSVFTSRSEPPDYLEGFVNGASEELAHMAIEKYIDVRYRPQMVSDTCEKADPTWVEDSTSICDGGETEFPIDCELCNPLRDGATPPSAELSDSCDRCFEGCNPWREVCPAQLAPNLPCAECKDEDDEQAACAQAAVTCIIGGTAPETCEEQRSDCFQAVEARCAVATEDACCEAMTAILEQTGILTADEVKEFSCQNDEALQPSDIAALLSAGRDKIRDQFSEEQLEQLEKYAPNDCYQGPLTSIITEKDALTIPGPDGSKVTLEGDWGMNVDLNGDGENDLINECMLWNCMQSPASCPLRALRAGLPPQQIGEGLVCDDVDLANVLENPTALLNTHGIAMSAGIYKKIFLERRYPENLERGSVGTYSLGGYVPNGVYAMTDMMQITADALEAIRRPIPYIIDECVIAGSSECQLAAEVTALHVALVAIVPVLVAFGIAALGIPLGLGIPIAVTSFAAAAIVIGMGLIIRQGAIPGFTMPLRAKREELLAHLENKWFETISVTADAMSGESCTQTCGGIFPEDGDCTKHRFLGLHHYFDWALEAYEIVGTFDCDENNYLTGFLDTINGEDGLSIGEIVDLVESGGTIILTQYLGCKLLDVHYEKALLPYLEKQISTMVLEGAAEQICEVGGFYGAQLEGTGQVDLEIGSDGLAQWKESCVSEIIARYGDIDDPVALIESLREVVAALDNGGLTEEQKDVVFPQLEQFIRLSSGVQVDLETLDTLNEVLECSATVDPIVGQVPLRKWIFEALEVALGEEASDMLEQIDRQLGYYEELLANGFDDLNPIPVDLEKFAPLYNTIQLNKLSLLGDGVSNCDTQLQRCVLQQLPLSCANEHKLCMDEINTSNPTGLLAMAELGNEVELTGGLAAAYDSAPMDTNADTFRQSFFQSQGYASNEALSCRDSGWNIMCNSVYSLDDPDDYCRNIEDWSPEYLATIVDSGGVIPECGKAIGTEPIDTFAAGNELAPYAPYPRDRPAPSMEPRPFSEAPWLDQVVIGPSGITTTVPQHRQAHNHRMYLDRVVPQDFAHAGLPDWNALSSETEDSYYPYETTRFAMTNKDSHVARLYAQVFAPYYCPEMGDNQEDWDCDTIPDLCDNCPQTYNPDQQDTNHIGQGDDCPSYNPITRKTPTTDRWSLCPSTTPLQLWDTIYRRFVRRWIIGTGARIKKLFLIGGN